MLDAIKNRKSIRFMRREEIKPEILNDIIEAGFHAPSGHNNKGWEIYYTTDENKLNELSQMHQWTKFVAKASAVICVAYDISDMEAFWVEDCSAFMENMLIQATEYGIGSCWIGVRGIENTEETVKNILKINPNYRVLSLCILGKTAKTFNFSKQIDIKSRIHKV